MVMSNRARHWWGVLAGLVLAPAIAAGLAYGTWRTLSGAQQFGVSSNEYRIGIASFAIIAILIGFAVGSRLSPLASLLPGLALTLIGGLWVAAPESARNNTGDLLPSSLEKVNSGYLSAAGMGLFLLIGLALLIGSLFPARWRAMEELQPSFEYERQQYERQQYEGQQPATDPLGYEHTPQYGRPGEGPPPYGTPSPADQPGFSTAPDWGTPRRDPNQP
jgi:hypothetical protein